MRFEIKSGGMVAILLGVTGLSFAVFLFGLLSGYDVGRESQSSAAQVATAYPVEPPPGSAPAASPAAAPSPAIATAPAPAAPPGMAADDEAAAPVAPVAAARPAPTKHTKTAHTSAAVASCRNGLRKQMCHRLRVAWAHRQTPVMKTTRPALPTPDLLLPRLRPRCPQPPQHIPPQSRPRTRRSGTSPTPFRFRPRWIAIAQARWFSV